MRQVRLFIWCVETADSLLQQEFYKHFLEKKCQKTSRKWKMSLKVMVFSKCFISGGKGVLLHHVKNPHGVTGSDTLPSSNNLLFASCPHPSPTLVSLWSPSPGTGSLLEHPHVAPWSIFIFNKMSLLLLLLWGGTKNKAVNKPQGSSLPSRDGNCGMSAPVSLLWFNPSAQLGWAWFQRCRFHWKYMMSFSCNFWIV